MPANTPLLQSAQMLRSLTQPRGATLIGLASEPDFWLSLLSDWKIDQVTLFEPDTAASQFAQHSFPASQTWTLHNQLVSDEAATATYYEASVKTASGLLRPELLKAIWPNLHAVSEKTVPATTLAHASPAPLADQWLIINCLPAKPVLKGAGEWLGSVDVVITRVLLPLSDASPSENHLPEQVAEDAGLQAVSTYLEALGFRHLFTHAGRHPHVAYALFSRDYKTLLNTPPEPEQEKEEEAQEAPTPPPVDIEALVQGSTRSIRTALTQTTNNLKHQTAAMLGVYHYIETGELPVLSAEANSWPVSPDFALHLIERLEAHPYELVIEFGSGYSTALIARVLCKQRERGRSSPVQHIAFEHLEKYHRKTAEQVRLATQPQDVSFLQLLHTPLENYTTPEGEVFAYYSCQSALQKISENFSGHDCKRALIVVDGPPAATGKHARYPALPIVTSILRGWQLDFLLDDYIRDEEKQIAKRWQDELTAQGTPFTFSEHQMEKNACMLSFLSEK